MTDKITFIEPDSCKQCEWKPPLPNNNGQIIAVENTWLIVSLPHSVVWFFVCPKCGAVWANKNAVENVKILKKAKDSKIIKPTTEQSAKVSKIIH